MHVQAGETTDERDNRQERLQVEILTGDVDGGEMPTAQKQMGKCQPEELREIPAMMDHHWHQCMMDPYPCPDTVH